MEDRGISINKRCPCSQRECPILGNCVLCVANHLEHRRHIPECLQSSLRPAVEQLAKQVELGASDQRPDADFWKTYDKEALLKRSIDRHVGGE